jgi:hypothetical protein
MDYRLGITAPFNMHVGRQALKSGALDMRESPQISSSAETCGLAPTSL